MKAKKAQNYLRQVEKIDTVIRNKLVEKDQWKDIALGITSHSDGERVQASGSKQKMADAIDRIVDMDAEINALIDKLVNLKREVASVIEQLPANEYDVLHKVYIQYYSLYDVAEMKGKSYSWVTTVHGRALKNVMNILSEKETENG